MCGIAGVVGESDPTLAVHRVRLMTADLARRGPDGEGIECWRTAVLGHRRLSIFDLSEAGSQPMRDRGRETALVFNGAVYNFRQLRRELESRGFSFHSNTDTEVILLGYAAWGIDALVAKLHGMFAFALWDERERRLFLVRDRLGVKPLLYASREGVLAFASTARALRRAGIVQDIDAQAMAEYLEFGYVTDDRCIWSGAAKLPAGHLLEWSNGAGRVRRYWSVPQIETAAAQSFAEAVDGTEERLLEAVRIRLDADVPVAALLSAGVDSSLICWAIKQAGADITAFTVGTPGDDWDETADATATARQLGIAHRVLPMETGESPEIEELTSAYGEPFACASAIGMLRVSRAVREHATVLLTGDGGDDVFLGYPEHRYFWAAERVARAIPAPVARSWKSVGRTLVHAPGFRRPVHFLDYATGGLGAAVAARPGLPYCRRIGLFGERLNGLSPAQRKLPWSPESARRLLSDFLEYDYRNRFVGEYLTKVDGASMYWGLEARSPFLDQKLWEYAACLPYSIRLHRGKLKAVLREIARRRIGARVASGPKRGFGIPVHRWLAGPWRKAVSEAFSDSVLERGGWVRSKAALDELERAVRAGAASQALWYAYVLECWMRQNGTAQAADAAQFTSTTSSC
ncbi:MAG TPA: asparagine synthase (glutamine-hydrolyzing) [Bryobacteraceae bacterium]|nr:asparagine synthase (glutamine-hydrolyzing) [Bryobacteraceae bacterium]